VREYREFTPTEEAEGMMRAYAFVGLAVLLLLPGESAAQGTLNVYCSVQAEWCQAIATEFQRRCRLYTTMVQPLA